MKHVYIHIACSVPLNLVEEGLYVPTLNLDLPAVVLLEVIKDRRWAPFRRKAEDI